MRRQETGQGYAAYPILQSEASWDQRRTAPHLPLTSRPAGREANDLISCMQDRKTNLSRVSPLPDTKTSCSCCCCIVPI